MKALKLYINTSVISGYYDSRNPDRLDLTHSFWRGSINHDKYISTLVEDEIDRIEDQTKKDDVLKLLGECAVLKLDGEIFNLTERYIYGGIIPRKHRNDAIHLATATVHEMDIIVSWNFRHLVKRKTRSMVNYINSMNNYHNIEIIAPPEL